MPSDRAPNNPINETQNSAGLRHGLRGGELSTPGVIALSAVLVVAYVLSAKLGLSFASLQSNATAVWPPSGLAIAAAMLFGLRLAPAVFAGAFLTNIGAGTDAMTAVPIALGNTAEAIAGAYLTFRLGGAKNFLSDRSGLSGFIVGAVLIATTISATVGVSLLTLGGYSTPDIFATVWLTWYVGDAVGALVITPLLMAWGAPVDLSRMWRPTHRVESLAVGAMCVLLAVVVFYGLLPQPLGQAPVGFLCIPPLVWAGLRLPQREATICLLLAAIVAIWGTVNGGGPFAPYPDHYALILLQSFVGVLALSTLALSVTTHERSAAWAISRRAHDELETRVAQRTADLRHVNTALAESEAKWRALTESSPDHTILVDMDGRILSINHLFPGYTMETVIGSDAFSYVPAEYRLVMRECFDRVIATGKPDFYEVEYRRDGTPIHYETAVGLVKSEEKIIGLTMSARDVTRQRRALWEIKNLNDQVRLLLESTGEGIFGFDTDLKCTFVNRAATAMLGYSPEDMLGKDVHALIHNRREDGTLRPRFHSILYRTIKERRSFTVEEDVLWARSGDVVPVQFSANPVIEDDTIKGAVVVFRNIAEARAVARKMDFLATHDALTGLVNRREFETRLRRLIEVARSEDSQHIVCYLDLDQFKVVNDTCGHAAGDELLRQLTLILFRKIRQGDTLARLGGDEFGILITHCRLEDGLRVINEFRQAVAEFRFVWESTTFTLGVSIGVTILDRHAVSVGNVLAEADTACYMAKDAGRNRIHVFQVDDADIARRRGEMQWVSRLQECLSRDAFSLYAQPIFALGAARDSLAPSHYEILLRMRDPQHGEIPPGAFIPAAERYNLMTQIDRWVVAATLRWLAENAAAIPRVACWTINLSGQSMNDAVFLGYVLEQLRASRVRPESICFEVTETAAVANLQGAVRFMKALKDEGCAFALDDFGSGMSSLAYLKNLPVDYLKIDGNFVRDVVDDPVDRAMIEAVTRIAKVMGIATIAEFVENDAILDKVTEIGVDFAQGYGLGKPAPLSGLIATQPVATRADLA